MKLKDLIKKSQSTQMKVIQHVKKLIAKGTIIKFTSLIQKTEGLLDNRICTSITPVPDHHRLRVAIRSEITKEDLNESSNDYCMIADCDDAAINFVVII